MLIKSSEKSKAGKAAPELNRHLARICPKQLRTWVETISHPRHFIANAKANKAVANWIADLFSSWNYTVSVQGVNRNIVARPHAGHNECILVGAHYDSVPETPGADDNGSAVAAMLGCAMACAQWKTPLPVMFVAFNREEDGLIGSQDFVEEFLPDSGLKIRCAHILEMVGYADHREGSQHIPTGLPVSLPKTGDFLGLLANNKAAGEMTAILKAARTYRPEFPVYGIEVLLGIEKYFPVLHRSDHAPFWQHKIPSVMWTDTSEFRNPHYHAETDTPDTLDYEFLKHVTQVLTACVVNGGEELCA